MTVPQVVYVVAVAIYLVFFVLFARFFVWKYLAERDHWGRRPDLTVSGLSGLAASLGLELPRFTILVPARNEAAVIAKTVEHLCRLDYPASRYEILVVTDEKEAQEARRTVPGAIRDVEALLLRGGGASGPHGTAPPAALGARSARLALQILADQALREYGTCHGRYEALTAPAGLAWVPRARRTALLRNLAFLLLEGRGRVGMARLLCAVERSVPGRPAVHLRQDAGALLGLALPVAAAYSAVAGNRRCQGQTALLRRRALGEHSVTREMLDSLTRVLSSKVLEALRLEEPGRLRERLRGAAAAALPTTQEVVEGTTAELSRGVRQVRIKHVSVPSDFDGSFGGRCTGQDVPSTKGRALNYGLGFVNPGSEMCGFYDAESRPDPRVLLYVAWRRLTARREALVLQGPVFQVRNFFEMGPYCRVAALYQAIAHEWYLPQLFRRLPFTGGTNLYMDYLLLRDLGGYDHGILTEDLELGVRAFVDAGVWPEYLPYASSEQTPPTLRSLFRQRLRWGTGHLQVMDKLRAARHVDPGRRRRLLKELFLKGQVEWTLYQLATLVPPAMVVLYALGYMDPHALPSAVHSSLSCLTLTYFGFTFYAYARYFGYLDMSSRPRSRLGWLSTLLLLVILPLAAFLFPVPYSTAMVLKSLGREPKLWVKTPRTAE